MFKVIKSFTSVYDAADWLDKNKLEGVSIETKDTLKSYGLKNIPYGRYHVVTKAAPLLAPLIIPGIAAAARFIAPRIASFAARRLAVPAATGIGAMYGLREAGGAIADGLTSNPSIPAALGLAGGAIAGGIIGHKLAKRNNKKNSEKDKKYQPNHHHQGYDGPDEDDDEVEKSISYEKFEKIVIKSVDLVLKAIINEPRVPSYPIKPSPIPITGAAQDIADQHGENWGSFLQNLNNRGFVVFDYETTGFQKPQTNQPVQAAALLFRNGKIADRLNLFMNPGEPLSDWSKANLTDDQGRPITDEWVRSQMGQREAHERLINFLGNNILVAHNMPFDLDVLTKATRAHGLNFSPAGTIDTVELGRQMFPREGRGGIPGPADHKLPTLVSHILGGPHSDAHKAEGDAFATGHLLLGMLGQAQDPANGIPTSPLNKEWARQRLDSANQKYTQQQDDYKRAKDQVREVLEGTDFSSSPVHAVDAVGHILGSDMKRVGKFLGENFRGLQMDDTGMISGYTPDRPKTVKPDGNPVVSAPQTTQPASSPSPASTQQTPPPLDQSAPKPTERDVTTPTQIEPTTQPAPIEQTEQKDLLKSISKLNRAVKSASHSGTLKSAKKNLKIP
jgi:DNA polymerase III epsilon subunit-like protein